VILENSSGLKECRNICIHIDWRMTDFYECSEKKLLKVHVLSVSPSVMPSVSVHKVWDQIGLSQHIDL
jgi:hypothetical protein